MSWPADQPLTLPPPGALLTDATAEQQAAVEEDKRRWLEAYTMLVKMQTGAIRKRLIEMAEPLGGDMRRRLNVMRGKSK